MEELWELLPLVLAQCSPGVVFAYELTVVTAAPQSHCLPRHKHAHAHTLRNSHNLTHLIWQQSKPRGSVI